MKHGVGGYRMQKFNDMTQELAEAVREAQEEMVAKLLLSKTPPFPNINPKPLASPVSDPLKSLHDLNKPCHIEGEYGQIRDVLSGFDCVRVEMARRRG